MQKNISVYIGVFLLILFNACNHKQQSASKDNFSGSESCIECHKKFYDLWAPSLHGKAMQPINKEFVKQNHFSKSDTFLLENKRYHIEMQDTLMQLYEQDGNIQKQYPLTWTLGGKNVFYFLTPLERGKLQTIPLAYDVKKQVWYNNPQSAIRHFDTFIDEALSWKDRMYTFNSSCFGCHVSQMSSNYNLANDTYHTTWKEPGINCETCHGPSAEHVKVCKQVGKNHVPDDLKIIITSTFTAEQHNSSCATCHAKMVPITKSYPPGDQFFNHYNLVALENRDFYPDGRDLGENYTYTSWKQNKCVAKSDLNCITCHTSSGRDRFAKNPNQACLQCHGDKAEDLQAHTMHPVDSEGSLCINCHMPKTEFGRMIRSDHSFRPPMPMATIRFGSPNACNICHTDKSPQWANSHVMKRAHRNYQKETLYWAQLIKEARDDNWTRIDEMLSVIKANKYNEVVIASLIRLLRNVQATSKESTLINSLNNNSSPLVRSSAAESLSGLYSDNVKSALLKALRDSMRVVRIASATTLASFNPQRFTEDEYKLLSEAKNEYLSSLTAREDDWSSHYNLGIFLQNQGDVNAALDAYETATDIYPQSIMPLINSSILYAYVGNNEKAEESLRKALSFDAKNEAANVNLGLLMAEKGNLSEAQKVFEQALEVNPKQAVAAYNLSVITAQKDIDKAIQYATIASNSNPKEPKYAYTLAFYQYKNNQLSKAKASLKKLVENHPNYFDGYKLLLKIYIDNNEIEAAKQICKKALNQKEISQSEKRYFEEQCPL